MEKTSRIGSEVLIKTMRVIGKDKGGRGERI
jgi:hypothetical protein